MKILRQFRNNEDSKPVQKTGKAVRLATHSLIPSVHFIYCSVSCVLYVDEKLAYVKTADSMQNAMESIRVDKLISIKFISRYLQ